MSVEVRDQEVIVRDRRTANRLHSSMFGRPSREGLVLAPEEAIFLHETGRLDLGGPTETFMRRFTAADPRFPVRYAVYQDLRSRGWKVIVVRRMGTDYRALRGDEEKVAIKIVHEEMDEIPMEDLIKTIRVISGTEFTPVIAVVDNDYDVNYYSFDFEDFSPIGGD